MLWPFYPGDTRSRVAVTLCGIVDILRETTVVEIARSYPHRLWHRRDGESQAQVRQRYKFSSTMRRISWISSRGA